MKTQRALITLVSIMIAVFAAVLSIGAAHADDTCDEEVFDHWQRYSWTGGPHSSDDPPAFPSSDWQPNVQGDPHGIGVAGAYFVSHGNSGQGDWFYLEAVYDTQDCDDPGVPTDDPSDPGTPTNDPSEEPGVPTDEDPGVPTDEDPGVPTDGDPGVPTDDPGVPTGDPGVPTNPAPYCLGDALVTVTIAPNGDMSTSHVNGHPDCTTGATAKQEGF